MSQSDSPSGDAAAKLAQLLPPAAVDALLADAEASGVRIDGPDGLLSQMTKAVLERALEVEMSDHLGYEHGDPAGHGTGNSRNGYGRQDGADHGRAGRGRGAPGPRRHFEPVIVPKRKRRLGRSRT